MCVGRKPAAVLERAGKPGPGALPSATAAAAAPGGDAPLPPARSPFPRSPRRSLPPAADADLLLVSVGEDVGLAGELGEDRVESAEVVMELLLQVLLSLALLGGPAAQLVLLAGGLLARRRLHHAPLDVVADGLEQHVVAVHVPAGEVGAGVAGRQGSIPGRAHGARRVQLLQQQRHVAQQAGHHHRLVHVVDGADEAVHGVEEGVLLAVRVADLHHAGGRAGVLSNAARTGPRGSSGGDLLLLGASGTGRPPWRAGLGGCWRSEPCWEAVAPGLEAALPLSPPSPSPPSRPPVPSRQRLLHPRRLYPQPRVRLPALPYPSLLSPSAPPPALPQPPGLAAAAALRTKRAKTQNFPPDSSREPGAGGGRGDGSPTGNYNSSGPRPPCRGEDTHRSSKLFPAARGRTPIPGAVFIARILQQGVPQCHPPRGRDR